MQLLREHDDYRRLWLAQSISQIGSQISFLAIPLIAAVSLGATPAEMGVLTAVGSLPSLVVGFLAGSIVDGRARRPILVSSDLGRAVLLGIIPVAWVLAALSMPLLYLVAFLSAGCSLFFGIAYQAFLPSLIDRSRLVEANSGLALSDSASQIAGQPLAGILIQLLKAPRAVTVDALSFLASAALIARIRTKESFRPVGGARRSIWSDTRDGIREVLRDPSIPTLAVGAAAINLFNAMLEAVLILYLSRSVGMQPGVIGVVYAVGGVGFVAGALLPGRLTRRLGLGPTMAVGIAVLGLGDLALPLVGRDVLIVALAVAVGQFFFGLGLTVYNVTQLSLRQALVPERLMGRVGGTLSVVGAATVPAGALIGGVLGQTVGLRPTLALAALLEMVTALLIWWSPLWSLRTIEMVPDASR